MYFLLNFDNLKYLASCVGTSTIIGNIAQNVLPYLKMLGDVSGGDAERFDRMTYSFGEMLSEGKLNGRQVREMINSGFNPLQ